MYAFSFITTAYLNLLAVNMATSSRSLLFEMVASTLVFGIGFVAVMSFLAANGIGGAHFPPTWAGWIVPTLSAAVCGGGFYALYLGQIEKIQL
ncbi:hypothetical protein F5Y08DRAFT_288142 [Xylaria arbuscula]|nr:hypothetical protein F5Y08DRAFT_288142 [Xylaria arbuscula]